MNGIHIRIANTCNQNVVTYTLHNDGEGLSEQLTGATGALPYTIRDEWTDTPPFFIHNDGSTCSASALPYTIHNDGSPCSASALPLYHS